MSASEVSKLVLREFGVEISSVQYSVRWLRIELA
jgi:hypothetical protein